MASTSTTPRYQLARQKAKPSYATSDDETRPVLTCGWTMQRKDPQGEEGTWLITTNSYIMLASRIEPLKVDVPDDTQPSGYRQEDPPPLPDGGIGDEALKHIEKTRQFDATDIGIEPVPRGKSSGERVVYSRPEHDTPKFLKVIEEARYKDTIRVGINMDFLMDLARGMGRGTRREHEIIMEFDATAAAASVGNEDGYTKAIRVLAIDDDEAADTEGVIMPIRLKRST